MDRLGVDGDCAACTCTVGDATEDGEKDDRRATTLIDAVAAAPDDDDDGYPFLCLDADAPVVGRRSHLFLRHWTPTLNAEDGEPHFRLSLSLTKTATFLMD